MRVRDLKNGQFLVELKGLPPFYTTSYQDALEIAFKMGGAK